MANWDTSAVQEIQRYAILAQEGGYPSLQGMTMSSVDGQGGRRTGNAMVAMTGHSVSQLNAMTEAQYADQLDAKMQNDPAFRDAVISGLENNPEMAQDFLQQQGVTSLDAYKAQLGVTVESAPAAQQPTPDAAEAAPAPAATETEAETTPEANPDLHYRQGLLAITEAPGVSPNDVTGVPNDDTEQHNDVALEEIESLTREGSTLDTLTALNGLATSEGGGYVGMLQSLLKSLGFDVEVTGEMDSQTTDVIPNATQLLENRDGVLQEVAAAAQDGVSAAPHGAGLKITVDGHDMIFDRDAVMEHGDSLNSLIMNSPEAIIALEAAKGPEATTALLEAAGIDPADAALRTAVEGAPDSAEKDALLERLDGADTPPEAVTELDTDDFGVSDLAAPVAAAAGLAAAGYGVNRYRNRNTPDLDIQDADVDAYMAAQDSQRENDRILTEYDNETERLLAESEREIRERPDQADADAERQHAQSIIDQESDSIKEGRSRNVGRDNALRAARVHMAQAHLDAAGLPEDQRSARLNEAMEELDGIVDREMDGKGRFLTSGSREKFVESIREEAFQQTRQSTTDINGVRQTARDAALATVDTDIENARQEILEQRAADRPGIANAVDPDAPDAPAADADPDAPAADADSDAPAADADPDAPAADADPDAPTADADPDAPAADADADKGRNRFGRAAMVGGIAAVAIGLTTLAVSAEELPDDVRELAENGDIEEAAQLFIEQGGGPYAEELQNLMETQPEMVENLMGAVVARAVGDNGQMAIFLGNLGLGEEVAQDFIDGNYGSVAAEVSGYAEARRQYDAAETDGERAGVVIGESAEAAFTYLTPLGLGIEGIGAARAGLVTLAEAKGIDLPSMEDAHREDIFDYFHTSDQERELEAFAKEAHEFLNDNDLASIDAPQEVVDVMNLHAQWVLAENALQQEKDDLPRWYANDRIQGVMEIAAAREAAVAAKELYETQIAALSETGELDAIREYMQNPQQSAPADEAPNVSPTEIGPEFMAQAADPNANPVAAPEAVQEETLAYSLVAYDAEKIGQGYMPIDIEAGALSIGDAITLHDMDVAERPELVTAAVEDAVMALPEAEREAFLEAAIEYYNDQPVIDMTDTPYGAVVTLQRDALVDVQEKLNAPDEVTPDVAAQPQTPASGYKAGLTS